MMERSEMMTRAKMWIVVAVVVLVIVVAGFGATWALRGTKNSDYTTFWSPATGSYAKFRQTNETLFNYNWTLNVTAVSVNATTVMRDEAWYNDWGAVYVENTWPAPVNLTFPNGFDINNQMGWTIVVTEVGVEDISTPWGTRTCICYEGNWTSRGWVDRFWVHNGVMIKTEGPPGEGYQGGSWELVETNIPEVTHQ